MTVYTEETTEQRQISPLVFTGAAVVILLLLALLLTREGTRPLKPIRPSATPVELTLNSQAILVTFDELNANPYAYHNQHIRVTGDYTPQPKPDCPDYKGLLIRWALINNSLQLNGRGFEEVLKLVPAGTTLTVEGVWRLYEGTVGCGKGAPQELIWYLQVERILQPNPLPGFGPIPDGGTPSAIDTPQVDGAGPTPTLGDGTAVPLPTDQIFLTPTASATFTVIPTLTPSATATATLPAGDLTATPVGGSPTPPPGTGTATATPNPTNPAATNTPPSLTTPGAATPTPSSLVTSTPGPSPTPGNSYPGPGTATVAPTLDPYPSN